jgi:hypothetical protein
VPAERTRSIVPDEQSSHGSPTAVRGPDDPETRTILNDRSSRNTAQEHRQSSSDRLSSLLLIDRHGKPRSSATRRRWWPQQIGLGVAALPGRSSHDERGADEDRMRTERCCPETDSPDERAESAVVCN